MAAGLALVLLAGCSTEETHAWEAHRAELERRYAEVVDLSGVRNTLGPRLEQFVTLRAETQLTRRIRDARLPARVFVDPGAQRVVVSGSVEDCLAVVNALQPAGWLLPTWRLRLEGEHCEYEAKTGELFVALEEALLVTPPRWTPPPPQVFSRDLSALKARVKDLERLVAQAEHELGDVAWLWRFEGRLRPLRPRLDAARAAPQPCVEWVLERELALDVKDRGQVLELTDARPIHPLEPRNDFRLRGILDVHDRQLVWHCEAK